jgi:DNA-binding IclR family transcriptional regulator
MAEPEDVSAKTASDGEASSGRSAFQSVERAAMVLSSFTTTRPRLTLSEITEIMQVSKATAHRYAVALRRVNMLRYDQASAQYTLGPQILTFGAAARAGLPIIDLAGPYMQRLSERVNSTVLLSIWDGAQAVVVRVEDRTDRVIHVTVTQGSRLAPGTTAQGTVFCAFLSDKVFPGRAALLEESPKLAATLDQIRERGFGLNSPERTGVRTIAAPVFDGNSICATIAIIGTVTTLPESENSEAVKSLLSTASELGSVLGAGGASDQPKTVTRRAKSAS